MKKKFLIVLLFTIMFLPILNVKALTCTYTKEGANNTSTTYKIVINSDNAVVYKNGTKVDKDVQIFNTDNLESCPKKENITIRESNSKLSIRSKVSCGNIDEIPEKIPELTSFVITVIQIAVPIILVVIGSIDLMKGVVAQKEEEIKKGQQMFIKRLIVAALVFFIIVIAKFLISLVANATDSANISQCIDCFLSGIENCGR